MHAVPITAHLLFLTACQKACKLSQLPLVMLVTVTELMTQSHSAMMA